VKLEAGLKEHKELNQEIKEMLAGGNAVKVSNVSGQRYIGSALGAGMRITLTGTPGNDLGCYMDGGMIEVFGNAQDGTGNTMNEGSIIVHGHCGDAAGYAMRGGEIYIKGNAGYRSGIHMKQYRDKKPVLVVGGCTGDFLGEYMAGGIILVLGLEGKEGEPTGRFCATGIHGGTIYIRGTAKPTLVGREATCTAADAEDMKMILPLIKRYCSLFGGDEAMLGTSEYIKICSSSGRPYGKMYSGI
jgi:glutamate synthase domain-containing protein 3